MSDHTKGPWLRRGGYDVVSSVDRRQVVMLSATWNVAVADAYLIAEAPSLLEVLKSLVWSSQNNTGAEPSLSCFHRDIDIAQAVIKAGEGKPLSDEDQQLIGYLWGE